MTTRAILICAALDLIGCSELDNCPDAAKEATVIGMRPAGSAEPQGAGGADGANAAEPIEPTPSIYESSPWGAARVAFPAKTCLRFYHGLKTTPEIVNSYVSFGRQGSDVTENAGNQGRIMCVDSEQIVIKNDTCEEEFYIRVVAYASGSGGDSTDCQGDLDSDGCGLPLD